jgi:hypothetical protein
MTPQASNIQFVRLQTEKVFRTVTSVDKELEIYFDNYLKEEYKEDISEPIDYCDIGEIARFIVDKLKVGQTELFEPFFANVENVLSDCDTRVENLIVVGLFESIQNICGTEIDYHYVFNSWLKKLSKTKWDELIDSWEGKEWRSKYNNNL